MKELGPLPLRHGPWVVVTLFIVSVLLPVGAAGQTDPLLEQQWHLKARSIEPAGANVRVVWPTTKGAGVVIGVVDDGLQHTHPDLQPNYSGALSFDFNFNDSDPSPNTSSDFHGTAVAGVAGARGDNGIGVSGAAPLASLAGLRLIAAPATDAQEASALGHQGDSIHISSNSWGPSDDGRTLAGPGPLAQSAIQTAITQGRAGKGRIFTWAAGNGLANQDNCNFDGYANSRFVIAVAALADNAQQAWYSEPCSAMFVTAPSSGGSRGITTTDLVGAPGYDSTDYTSTFGGTSSATPLVSGVVGLMLAQNPSLSWRDVKHVLTRSSVRINPTDPGWTTGTFAHNEKYGFGLVDAQAAVNLAATWTNVAAESAIPAVTRTLNLTIPDNNATGLTDSITIGTEFSNFAVEHVEVVFDATHSWRGDLEVTLTSPAGVVSRLATVRANDSGDNFSSWRFGSVRHWGESAAGAWMLRVADRVALDVGTWNSWTLRIFGTQGSPALTVAPTGTVDFGNVTVGSFADRTFTVQNTGAGTLTGSASTTTPFSIVSGGSFSLGASASQSVVVRFSPTSGATFAGSVTFTSNGGNTSRAVTGTGVGAFTLTVTVRGSASGTVTSAPAGMSCSTGSTCIANFTNGTPVTLTEAPGSGASFKQWGGACSGTATTCAVTMTANQSVTATFSQLFTDPTLTAGSTPIKAVHVTELRSAINTLRAVNSLAAFGWTDPTLTAGSTPAKKVHLDELRTALTQAYQAAGQSPPSYTDSTIVAQQTPIKASHISELRAAVRALE